MATCCHVAAHARHMLDTCCAFRSATCCHDAAHVRHLFVLVLPLAPTRTTSSIMARIMAPALPPQPPSPLVCCVAISKCGNILYKKCGGRGTTAAWQLAGASGTYGSLQSHCPKVLLSSLLGMMVLEREVFLVQAAKILCPRPQQ